MHIATEMNYEFVIHARVSIRLTWRNFNLSSDLGTPLFVQLESEEDHMLKPVIAATALVALAGTSLVYAQQGFDGRDNAGNGGPRFERRHMPSPADISAFTDARIAALKAGLELTPDQAKNWPPFEQALRDMAQLRIQGIQARLSGEQQATTTPFDRLERRADAMAKRSAALKKVADAGAPLYASLNDDQKARFMRLARILRPHPRMHAFMERHWRRGEGYGRGEGGWQHGRHFGQTNDGNGTDRGSQL
jgi:zinc resistance-associated protein